MKTETPPPLPIEFRTKSSPAAFVILGLIPISVALLWGGYEYLYWNAHRPGPIRSTEQINRTIEADMQRDPVRRSRPDDWDKGYDLGYKMGRLFATSGEPVPTEEALRAAASEISSHSSSILNKEQFDKAYYSGFAQGYKDASKPAF